MKRELGWWVVGFALAWILWASATLARAEAPRLVAAAPATAASAAPAMESLLREAVQRAGAPAGTRLDVEIAAKELPPSLAGCTRIEPYVPDGTRLRGRTFVGARCIEGGTGAAFIPVVVHVYGPALAATRNLPAGHTLGPADLKTIEVDHAALPGTALADPAQAVGQVLSRAIEAGAPLRMDGLRIRLAVVAGDTVRVVYQGQGFSVSAEAKALGSAPEGQSVRAQTEAGRVVTGTARAGRVIEIAGF